MSEKIRYGLQYAVANWQKVKARKHVKHHEKTLEIDPNFIQNLSEQKNERCSCGIVQQYTE